MTFSNELSIVIPVRNDERVLPRLMASLAVQDYPRISCTPIFLVDGGSTDRTIEMALAFHSWLNIISISGATGYAGRNAGAQRVRSRYVLFLNPDIELADCTLLRRAVEKIKWQSLHCVTTNVVFRGHCFEHRLSRALDNMARRLSRLFVPIGTAAFLMLETERFMQMGGFDEQSVHADYSLTRQISPRKFRSVRGHVYAAPEPLIAHSRDAFLPGGHHRHRGEPVHRGIPRIPSFFQ